MLKISSSTPFARPANTTAYASGDLVANSATAADVAPGSVAVHPKAGNLGRIKRARLHKSGSTITNAAFRIHFYLNTPVATNGDNGVWLTTDAGYLGAIDVTVDRAFVTGASGGASGIGVPVVGTEIPFDLPASLKRLFFLIEARGSYTPESAEQFTVTAEIETE